jgi:hypothetical protein
VLPCRGGGPRRYHRQFATARKISNPLSAIMSRCRPAPAVAVAVALLLLATLQTARAGIRDAPEASDLHIHTTGPNCWGTGELGIKYVSTVPGAPSPPEALAITAAEITRHIGAPTFVNMSETGTLHSCMRPVPFRIVRVVYILHLRPRALHFVALAEFSCVDGRYPRNIITTAGGDAAEFMLGLQVLNVNFGLPMNQYVVSTIFRNYMLRMSKDEPLRKFYYHTDEHAWEHLTGCECIHVYPLSQS